MSHDVLSGWAMVQAENSEVLPAASVSSAVTTCPLASVPGNVAPKPPLPDASVVAVTEPR